jgi:hypothetical protein
MAITQPGYSLNPEEFNGNIGMCRVNDLFETVELNGHSITVAYAPGIAISSYSFGDDFPPVALSVDTDGYWYQLGKCYYVIIDEPDYGYAIAEPIGKHVTLRNDFDLANKMDYYAHGVDYNESIQKDRRRVEINIEWYKNTTLKFNIA